MPASVIRPEFAAAARTEHPGEIYARRRNAAFLTRAALSSAGGALVVYLSGARPGRATVPASPDAITHATLAADHERMIRFWQIGSHIADWRADRAAVPEMLIAVTGRVDARWVWGSIRLDRNGWGDPSLFAGSHGLYQVPSMVNSPVSAGDLDWRGLRGRACAAEFGPRKLKDGRRGFHVVRALAFDVVPSSGRHT